MDGANAIKIASRTAGRLESRLAHRLSEEELKGAKGFMELVLLEFCDRQLSRAVIARAQYEADYPGKGYKRTAAYAVLLNEQLGYTRQLVELLMVTIGCWVYWTDGKYVLLSGGTHRIRCLQEQVWRLSKQANRLAKRVRVESA